MSKLYIQNISEMTDSCEVLHEKPHKFMSLLAYILILLLLIALAWACIGEIDYYVKASGFIRPGENVSTIKSPLSGKLINVNICEGQKVTKGDVLFKIDTQLAAQTLDDSILQRNKYELDIKNLEKYILSITQGENLFDSDNIDEQDYYYKYEKYATDTASSLQQYTNTNLDISKIQNEATASLQNATEKLEEYNYDFEQITYLIDSIETKQNKFEGKNNNSTYFYKYNEYLSEIEKYEQAIIEQKNKVNRTQELYNVGGVSKVEYEKTKTDLSSLELQLAQYNQTILASLKQTKDQLSMNITDMTLSQKNAQSLLNVYSQKGYSEDLLTEQMKLDAVVSASNQINAQQNNLDSINTDITKLKYNIENAEVIAPIDGTINMYMEISPSDYIDGGTQICTIVPDSKSKYKVQLYINSSDVSEVAVNQNVRIRVSALPYQEYGELTGKIVSISSDSRIDNSSGVAYYIAECELDNTEIKSKNSEVKNITSGMDCELRVVTKQRKIISWVLEKLDFID